MATNRTFTMLKPDAIENGHAGKISSANLIKAWNSVPRALHIKNSESKNTLKRHVK